MAGRNILTRKKMASKFEKLIEQAGSLGNVTKKQTESHGKKPHGPQLPGTHVQNLPEPFFHGLRKGNIRKALQNKHQAYQCNE
jgi:hypothetical protein